MFSGYLSLDEGSYCVHCYLAPQGCFQSLFSSNTSCANCNCIALNLSEASVKALLVATYRHLLPSRSLRSQYFKSIYTLYRWQPSLAQEHHIGLNVASTYTLLHHKLAQACAGQKHVQALPKILCECRTDTLPAQTMLLAECVKAF